MPPEAAQSRESSTKHRGGRTPQQRYLAEFIGTFVLVFIGCGSVVSNGMSTPGAVTLPGIAACFGLAVAVMIYALGPISAAHINPAVTIAFAAVRRFPWRFVPAYVGSQLAGALVAALVLRALYGETMVVTASYGATSPNVGIGAAFGFEVLLTFILMLVIMAMATDRRVAAPVPGIAIGLTVAICIMVGGPATGASLNPARSFGPALLAGGEALRTLVLYLAAPCIGALLAAFCYETLRDDAEQAQSAPADLEESLADEPGLSRN